MEVESSESERHFDRQAFGQVDRYWSESNGDFVQIHEMNAGHALNAWRRLKTEAHLLSQWPTVRTTPLMGALLRQAVGEDVTLSSTLPEVELWPEDEVFVRAYDAVEELDSSTYTHPMRRAMIVARHFKTGSTPSA